jgi:hypothetical protein
MSKVTNLAQALGAIFDATQVAPSSGGSTLSVGKHIVKIVDGELTATKTSNGGMIVLTVEAIDPQDPDFGRTMDYRLNIHHENPKVVEIARQQLSAICHVTGVFQVQDLQQLFNIPFMVEVGNQKLTPDQMAKQDAGEKVEPYKEIKAVFDTGGAKPGQSRASAPAQTAQVQQQAQQGAAWGQPAAQAQPAQQQAEQAPAQQAAPAWGQAQPAAQAAPAAAPAWGGSGNAAPAQQQTSAPWGQKA